ncbi:MAG TPA: HD-GYP domain-containing protein [Spirochaetia bacterium]|nr:HD-GYP domain-containing protein [Spirochaetia bacterium]
MKTIKVSALLAGQMFSKPVYVDGDTILLPANIPLREKDLERLKKWKIEAVQTDGEPVSEGESEKGDNVATVLKKSQNSKLLAKYVEAVKAVDGVLKAVEANSRASGGELAKLAEELVQLVEDNPDQMVSFTIQKRVKQTSPSMSSVNCLILSVVIGLTMKLPRHHLIQLALGALLHDIGMAKVPKSVLDKTDNLSAEEIDLVRKHATYSYSLAIKGLGLPEEVGLIALQHHERWDGKGYPSGIAGNDISLLARIVAVADSFEAMIRDRPYRNSMIGYQAMRQILNDNSRRFDSEILKVFIKSMGIYPRGSIVLLNDGSIGRVERIHGDAPLRPALQLIVDKRGRRLPPEKAPMLDLLEEKALFIARAISPKEANAEA